MGFLLIFLMKGATLMSTIRRRDTGFFQGDNAIFDRHDLSVYEKIVYLYLCRRADSESRAWPSYNRIGMDCGISRDTAIRAIAKLIEKGLLIKNVRKDANGNLTSNEYILLSVGPEKKIQQQGSSCEQPGVVATSDQVVADSNQGSSSQLLGVVAVSDCNNTHINNTQLTTTTLTGDDAETFEDPLDLSPIVTKNINQSKKPVFVPLVNEGAIEICWQSIIQAKGVDIDRGFIAKNLVKYATRGGVDYFLEKVELLKQTIIKSTVQGFLTDALKYDWKPGQKGNLSTPAELNVTRASQKKKVLMRSMYS